MRTTVDLPPAVHARVTSLAQEQHRSLSAVLAELVGRGLAQLDGPTVLSVHAQSGLPVLTVSGPAITAEAVAEALDD